MLAPRESRTRVSLAPSVGGRFQGFEDYRALGVALPVLVGLVGDKAQPGFAVLWDGSPGP